MSLVLPTVGGDVEEIPQYTEEKEEGILPLNDGKTPTAGKVIFKTLGLTRAMGKEFEISNNKIRPLGEWDITKIPKLGIRYRTSIAFEPYDFDLMYYGGLALPVPHATRAPDPSMTTPNESPAVSISILMSALINGVKKFRTYTGVRFTGISGDISKSGGFKVTMPILARNISLWNNEPAWTLGAGSAGATYASTPAGDPLSATSSGANPLTVDGTVFTTNSFRFNITLGIAEWDANGDENVTYMKMANRAMNCQFNTLVLGNDLETKQTSWADADIIYVIGGGRQLQFLNSKGEAYNDNLDGDATEFFVSNHTFVPTQLVVVDP